MLELVVVRFDLVPGDAPVLQMAVLGNERCAIAFLDARVHFEIMREKAARIAAPVCRRATDHLAWLECAHLAHRQRRLRVVVAKCDGVARQVLKDVAMAIELQFVVHIGLVKIGVHIERLAALQAHDAQPGAGQFHRHDRAHDAAAHDNDIHNQTALLALTICDLYKSRWQVELLTPPDQEVLRDLRKRGENADLDRGVGLRAGSYRPEAAEAGGVTLHIDAGVFGDSIRKGLDRICNSPSGRQFRT